MADANAQQWTGFRLKDGRRGGICWAGKPRCVAGHRLKPRDPEQLRTLSTEMVTRCQHKHGAGHPICGALLYVAVVSFGPRLLPRCERCLIVVELREDMLDSIGDPMLFIERMALIDVALPGVGLDIGVRGERE